MKVLVVSGFLGAGKTTFIKELINRTQKYLVVLENEYGQTSLDKNEIKGSSNPDLKLLEFMEGCVCCTQKDTFSNTILSISAGLDPEYLVVEPTGIGKLSNILNAIKKVSYDKITILKPIVVISSKSFKENLNEFKDICKDQIINAETIVLSKIENENPSLIADTINKIRELNKNANIIDTHYKNMDINWWNSLLFAEGENNVVEVNEEKVDFSSINIKNGYLNNVGELITILEDLIHYEFGNIVRAKGVIKVGKDWLRFDVADRLYAIIEDTSNQEITDCVFIGEDIIKAKLLNKFNSFESISDKKGNIDKSKLFG